MPEPEQATHNEPSTENKKVVNGKIAIKSNSGKRRISVANEKGNTKLPKKPASSLANSSNLANIAKKNPKKKKVSQEISRFEISTPQMIICCK
jgi:hypothetical protein